MSVKIYLKSERGEAGFKLLLFIIVISIIGFAGFNYVPVAYEAASFKQEMETAVIKAIALPQGLKPVDAVRTKLKRAMVENNIPDNSFMDVKQVKNVIQARIYYQREVEILPFGLYRYTYVFDHTATPTGFLLKES